MAAVEVDDELEALEKAEREKLEAVERAEKEKRDVEEAEATRKRLAEVADLPKDEVTKETEDGKSFEASQQPAAQAE